MRKTLTTSASVEVALADPDPEVPLALPPAPLKWVFAGAAPFPWVFEALRSDPEFDR